MRIRRIVACACLLAEIVLGTHLFAGGLVGSASAATIENPAHYGIDVSCYATSDGGSRCTFVVHVDGGDAAISSFAVPAAALCAEVVGTDMTHSDDGSLVIASDSGSITFAGDVTADEDQPVLYRFSVGETDDDTTTIPVSGAGLVCNTPPVGNTKTEVLIVGLNCAADPGDFDPWRIFDGVWPAGCQASQAAVYDVTIEGAPELSGSQVADRFGSVQLTVPTGSRVTITLEPFSGLPGYSARENPIVLENVQADSNTAIFVNLPDSEASPSPEPSQSPEASPSPSPEMSPSPDESAGPSPSPSASASPDASASPSPGDATGLTPNPATTTNGTDPRQTSEAGRSTSKSAAQGASGVIRVTQLPATGGARPPRDERDWWLVYFGVGGGCLALGWRIWHHGRRARRKEGRL